MKRRRLIVLTGVLAATLGPAAARASADPIPIIVNFADLRGNNRAIGAGHSGINSRSAYSQVSFAWGSAFQRIYPTYGSGLSAQTVSERFFGFNTRGRDFSGSWFAGYGTLGGVPAYIRFTLHDGGTRVASSSVMRPGRRTAFLPGGFPGNSSGPNGNAYGFWAKNDVTTGSNGNTDLSPVPEPTSILLIGTGVVGLLVRNRRRLGASGRADRGTP